MSVATRGIAPEALTTARASSSMKRICNAATPSGTRASTSAVIASAIPRDGTITSSAQGRRTSFPARGEEAFGNGGGDLSIRGDVDRGG